MTIQASEQRLAQIFNLANYQFEIPSYQRPYAWGSDQVLELIDDLLDAFPYPDENSPVYFLGSIILIEKSEKPKVEIVDGQQRLTTLTLLISVFRHLLSSESNACQCINDLIEKQGIGSRQYGLKVRSQDDSFFGKYIRTPGGIETLLEKNAGLETDSQILLRDNTRLLVTELVERCPENIELESWIVYLLENILEKCYLVTVSTSDFDTAYRIFSTINTRGLDLQLNDILKSEIIGSIEGENDRQKYTQIWDGEESDLGRKDFEALFSYIHRIKLREKPKESLLTEYRKKIKPQNNPIQFIDEVLKPCSDVFEIIRDQRFSCDNKEDEQEINRLFGWLNLIDNSDWLPPAIHFLVRYSNTTFHIKEFFINLERLAAGLMIVRADINNRGRRYTQLLKAIDQSAEAAISKAKDLLSAEDQNKIFKTIDGNLYQQNSSCLYVLKRLDSALAEGGLSPSFDAKMVTIEHILPQNPKPNSQWCETWTEADRETWVNRLGNLALLSRKKNAAAQNYDFDKKKGRYFKEGSQIIFPLTIDVIHQNQWTIKQVKENQKKYLNILTDLWNLEYSTSMEITGIAQAELLLQQLREQLLQR
ncbi:DUF262 domain-containing protein [Crocosphaera sp. XPORK-15E]|uniref:DUF262 domain-containing protein n=1 Tax=Crocosphaera sp. XPORK-15E TaxID=3110247 RepID=UPI002B20450C|nr:DUF262 domain-containing protein [Crocosphaera sp. XPORK-15E]MEA5535310.1 DUF262 domain-containing protein [Crocosphaera sp. XPORK-15E]